MIASSPIVKRVDHIMIRVVDPVYDQLFSLLTQRLQLPVSWPVNEYAPGFKTGGVFAGNISMEIFRSGTEQVLASPAPSQAQLYGIAFEPYDLARDVQEVDRRGMAHLPFVPVPEGRPYGTMGSMWTLLFFGDLLGCDLLQYQAAMKEVNAARNLSPFFTTVFHNGMIFLCEYTKTFYDTTQGRLSRQAELQAKYGGPLRLVGTQEIVVGAKDVEAAHQQWQRLFEPIAPTASGLWPIGDGPAIRLIPHTQDSLVRLVWRVASLQQARAFLDEQGIAHVENNGLVMLSPGALFGLEIWLVE